MQKSKHKFQELLNRQASSLHAGADSQPLLFIVLFSGLTLIILLIISIAVIFHQNPYGAGIKIDGLEKISGLPRNEKDRLESELYNIVAKNLQTSASDNNQPITVPTSGASVVKSTITYSTDNSSNDRNYRSARFLVELKSLKMAYVATVEWTSSRDKSALSGYPVALTCPTLVSENFYPETPCSDFISDNLGSSLPLLRYLPLRTNDYILNPVDPSLEKPKLEATLLVHSWQTPYENLDQKIAELKQGIEDYIKSTGSNPDDYEIIYKTEYGD